MEYALYDAGEVRQGHITNATKICRSYGFANAKSRAYKVCRNPGPKIFITIFQFASCMNLHMG